MKETLTDIINKFILTSLTDIEEEYHDEVRSMMQLIGLINYMKVYAKRRINRYELTKLYDLGMQELQKERIKYEKKSVDIDIIESSNEEKTSTAIRHNRSDVLIHYPFQDDHSHVSDIIKMDKAEKSSLKKSLKYQLPTSNFIKMSELGRSKVITQVFNEMKVGAHGLMVTDIPMAFESLGFKFDPSFTKVIKEYGVKVAAVQKSSSMATAKVGGPLEPYITVDQWVKMVERFISIKMESETSDDIAPQPEYVSSTSAGVDRNQVDDDDDRVKGTGNDEDETFLFAFRNKMHKKKQQDIFTPNLNSNKTIDIVDNFLNGDIGKGLVRSAQPSQASMYDEYTKYKYKEPVTRKGYFMRDVEHEESAVRRERNEESVKHVAYLLGIDDKRIQHAIDKKDTMNSVNIQNYTENNIKEYKGKTTIELLEESRRIQQEGWRPLNKGWVADFSSNMNTNLYNPAVVNEVGNKGTLQKLANVEVLVPENVASFEEVIKKLNPPVNVSSPKQAGGNANKKSTKVTGPKVTGPLTHSPKATSPVNDKSTKSTSPLVFNNVVDGSSNTEGFNEMEKNIQVDMSFDIRSTSSPSSPDNSLLNSSLLASPHAKQLASSQTFGMNEGNITGDFDDDDSFDVGSK